MSGVTWEWRGLKPGETERICEDCGQAYIPTNRNQKWCADCRPAHRGKAYYGGNRQYYEHRKKVEA